MSQTNPKWFVKPRYLMPGTKVFVVLDHTCGPDQLRDRIFYTEASVANRVADKMRGNNGGPPTAIEVVELEFACE